MENSHFLSLLQASGGGELPTSHVSWLWGWYLNMCNFKWFGSNSQLTLRLEQLCEEACWKHWKGDEDWWERETKFHLKIYILTGVRIRQKKKKNASTLLILHVWVIIAEGGRGICVQFLQFCFTVHLASCTRVLTLWRRLIVLKGLTFVETQVARRICRLKGGFGGWVVSKFSHHFYGTFKFDDFLRSTKNFVL